MKNTNREQRASTEKDCQPQFNSRKRKRNQSDSTNEDNQILIIAVAHRDPVTSFSDAMAPIRENVEERYTGAV